MNKEKVWSQIADQTQVNIRGELRLTPKGARQFFDLVWQKALDSKPSVTNTPDVPDFLKGIFG